MKILSFYMDFDDNDKDIRIQIITILEPDEIVGNIHGIFKTHILELSDVFVAPHCRRLRVAANMIEYAKTKAIEKQKTGIGLIVGAKNTLARQMYESLGFVIVSDCDEDDIAMFLKI